MLDVYPHLQKKKKIEDVYPLPNPMIFLVIDFIFILYFCGQKFSKTYSLAGPYAKGMIKISWNSMGILASRFLQISMIGLKFNGWDFIISMVISHYHF